MVSSDYEFTVFTSLTWAVSYFMKNKLNNYYTIGIISNLKHVYSHMFRQNCKENMLNYTCSPKELGKLW